MILHVDTGTICWRPQFAVPFVSGGDVWWFRNRWITWSSADRKSGWAVGSAMCMRHELLELEVRFDPPSKKSAEGLCLQWSSFNVSRVSFIACDFGCPDLQKDARVTSAV